MQIKISTRLVILTKNRAYKIPLGRRGWLQGKNENFIWNKYETLNLLAPLFWEFLGIVCQMRIKPIKEINSNKVRAIKNSISEFNFSNCDLYNAKNWGKYNDTVLLLDYGVNEEISKMYKIKK